MNATRQTIGVALTTFALLATGACAASATTLYVNPGGNDANACVEPGAPCKTIGAAITKAQSAPEASTIQVGPGVYQEGKEALEVNEAGDAGLAVVGEGSGAGGT